MAGSQTRGLEHTGNEGKKHRTGRSGAGQGGRKAAPWTGATGEPRTTDAPDLNIRGRARRHRGSRRGWSNPRTSDHRRPGLEHPGPSKAARGGPPGLEQPGDRGPLMPRIGSSGAEQGGKRAAPWTGATGGPHITDAPDWNIWGGARGQKGGPVDWGNGGLCGPLTPRYGASWAAQGG